MRGTLATGGALASILLCIATDVHADSITAVAGGTAAPSPTLGGYTMTPFGDDTRANFVDVTTVASPLGGDVTFGNPVEHRTIGSGWATWSHGYTGDVYWSKGATTVDMAMPDDTAAFYFYAEPNQFSTFTMTAVADDGTTVSQDVSGSSGASYFGFYTDGSVELLSVSISSTSDFAVGEFGIAEEAAVAQPVPLPAAAWGGIALFGALGGAKLRHRKSQLG